MDSSLREYLRSRGNPNTPLTSSHMSSGMDVPLSERLKNTFGSLGGAGAWLPTTAGVFRSNPEGNAHQGDSEDDSDNHGDAVPPAMLHEELVEDIDQEEDEPSLGHERQRQTELLSSRSRRQFEQEPEEDENDRMAMGQQWTAPQRHSPPLPADKRAAAGLFDPRRRQGGLDDDDDDDDDEEDEQEGKVMFAGSTYATNSSYRSSVSSLSNSSR